MAARRGWVAVALAGLVGGCSIFGSSGSDTQTTYTTDDPYHYRDPRDFNPATQGSKDTGVGSLISSIFNGPQPEGGSGGGGGIGVNSYLWRASLDTVRFMPLASADPFGGVIITDWYSPPDTPNERFKVNLYILGRQLRADGVRVSVFHQHRDAANNWAEAPVDANTGTDLENAILTRARELRLSTAQN